MTAMVVEDIAWMAIEAYLQAEGGDHCLELLTLFRANSTPLADYIHIDDLSDYAEDYFEGMREL